LTHECHVPAVGGDRRIETITIARHVADGADLGQGPGLKVLEKDVGIWVTIENLAGEDHVSSVTADGYVWKTAVWLLVAAAGHQGQRSRLQVLAENVGIRGLVSPGMRLLAALP
jgi:hypothetical protein